MPSYLQEIKQDIIMMNKVNEMDFPLKKRRYALASCTTEIPNNVNEMDLPLKKRSYALASCTTEIPNKVNEMDLPLKKRSYALAFCNTEMPNKVHQVDHESEKAKANKLCYIMKSTTKTLKFFLSKPTSSSSGALNTEKPAPTSMIENNNSVPVVRPKKRVRVETTHQRGRREDRRRGGQSLNDDPASVLASLLEQIKSNNMDYKDVTDARIILEKKLTPSDTKDHQARLAIPALQILVPFLTFEEETFLKKKTDEGKNTRIHVKVIMWSSEYNMYLSRWKYDDKKNTKKPVGWKYVLQNKEWNKLRENNKLQKGDIVRIVSFRSQKRLNFAILGPKCVELFGKRIASYPW